MKKIKFDLIKMATETILKYNLYKIMSYGKKPIDTIDVGDKSDLDYYHGGNPPENHHVMGICIHTNKQSIIMLNRHAFEEEFNFIMDQALPLEQFYRLIGTTIIHEKAHVELVVEEENSPIFYEKIKE